VSVWLIPETLAKTNLSTKSVGDNLNIEVDVLAKYVERLIARGQEK
jgi:riboflavin synthase